MLARTSLAGRRRPVRLLTIAGSDSGGGAGIAADLKAFALCGVHGACAITAVTAQNTTAVESVLALSPAVVAEQIEAVVCDIGVDAVKIGMLPSGEVAERVASVLCAMADVPVVLDPVLVAESGSRLAGSATLEVIRDSLAGLATVVTPNRSEAVALVGGESDDAASLARRVLELGSDAVVLTGGDSSDGADVLARAEGVERISGKRYPADAAHGSGCTHASVLASRLALGDSVPEAARVARELAGRAVANGLDGIGAGSGPVDVLGDVLPKVGVPDGVSS